MKQKIDWKRKLSSRKFWVAIVSIVTGLLLLFGFGESEIEQIGGLVMTIGGTVAYIFGEAWADSQSGESK